MQDKSYYICFKSNAIKAGLNEFSDSDIADLLMILSPKLMKWDDKTWIVDLSPTISYWRNKLTSYRKENGTKKTLASMFTEIFEAAFEFEKSHIDVGVLDFSIEKPFLVSFTENPWKSLILLRGVEERKLSGFMHSESTFSKRILKEISWDIFWSLCEEYGRIFESLKGRKSVLSSFEKDLRSFKLAISRLNLGAPIDLKGASEVQVGRRFGHLCSMLWQWTRMSLYSQSFSCQDRDLCSESKSELRSFLWSPYLVRSPLLVSRHLDFTAQNWSEIEELMRQDFSKLCALDAWSSEDKVVCLEWSVITSDSVTCPIPINFRMPHHMKSEVPHHKTALRQAHYNFEKMDFFLSDFNLMKVKILSDDILCESKMEEHESEGANDENQASGIIGWVIQVKERILIPSFVKSLFGFESSDDALVSVLNRFKVDAVCFHLEKDWLPEDSFTKDGSMEDNHHQNLLSRGERNEKSFKKEYAPFIYPNFKRPLFLFEKAQPASEPEGELSFLERSMDKWWRKRQGSLRRDYYLHKNEQGQNLWVYKDEKGRWFKHGIFS